MKTVASMVRQLVSPLVKWNAAVYSRLNEETRHYLLQNERSIPDFVTANRITTGRSFLVVPTLFAYSNGYAVVPASLVVVNVALDYVDGAVARWEQEKRKPRANEQIVPTARESRLRSTFGAYYDAVADKAFAIPVWLCIFQNNPERPLLQVALLSLAGIEMYSAFTRTQAFFDEPSPLSSEPKVALAPRSAVVASSVGKAKQALSMVGTSLAMIPIFQGLGTALLICSVPLAVASVQEKIRSRIVYCEVAEIKPATLEFVEQAKMLGSKLVVGVVASDAAEGDEIFNCLLMNHSVSGVIPWQRVPPRVNQGFLDELNIQVVAVESFTTFEEQSNRFDPSLFAKGSIIPVHATVE